MTKPTIMKQAFFLFISALLAGSCSKDNDSALPDAKPIVLFPASNWPSLFVPLNDNIVSMDEPATFSVYVTYAYRLPTDTDIPVEVALEEGIVEDYNNTFGTAYEALPDSVYNVTLDGLTIAAGTNRTSFDVNLLPEKLETGIPYLLCYSLAGAGENPIADNKRYLVIPIVKE